MFSKIHMIKLFTAAAATACLFAVSNAKADTQANSDQHTQTQTSVPHHSFASPQHAISASHKTHSTRHKHHKTTRHHHHSGHKTQHQSPPHSPRHSTSHAPQHTSPHTQAHHAKHTHATPTLRPAHLTHVAPTSVTPLTVAQKPITLHRAAPLRVHPQIHSLHLNKKAHIVRTSPHTQPPSLVPAPMSVVVAPLPKETSREPQVAALIRLPKLNPVTIQTTPLQTLQDFISETKKREAISPRPQTVTTASATREVPRSASTPVTEQKIIVKPSAFQAVPVRTRADGLKAKSTYVATTPSQQKSVTTVVPSNAPRQSKSLTPDQVALLQNYVQPVTVDPAPVATDIKQSDALVDQITGKPIVFYNKLQPVPMANPNTKLPDSSCFVYYSQHWTTTTDSDGDHKHQSVTCDIPSTNYAMWNIDFESSLQTPEVGTNNPIPHQYISVDGKATPSNQEDTGIAYISVGQTLGYQDAYQVRWGFRGGEINGAALNIPRAAFKDIHNAEGEGSRVSPASSKAQILIGGTIAASYPIVDFTSAADALIPSTRMTINFLPSATIGTDERSAEIGVSANIGLDGQLGPQFQQSEGARPSNFSTGLSVELSGEYVNYSAVTHYAGTREFQAQAKTALQYSLNNAVALQLNGMVRLTPEVNNPVRNLPNKFEVGAAVKFAF